MVRVTLQSQLEALSSKPSQLPDDIRATLLAGTALLEPLRTASLKPGSRAPDFTLLNATGIPITLSKLLLRGPVVLSFYRGGWCPYCNIELHALQKCLPTITALGATLVAVTPEPADHSLDTVKKNTLSFEVLSDPGNIAAKGLQVFYEVDQGTKDIYTNLFKCDIGEWNGEETGWGLPLPGTFVIDRDGTIVYAFIDPNYKKRAEPDEIVGVLRDMLEGN